MNENDARALIERFAKKQRDRHLPARAAEK